MGAIGKRVNPRKLYRFAVECDGLETAYVQKVKLPKVEIKGAKHGNGPFVVSTASKVEFGNLEMDSLKPADDSAVWWKDWLALVVNLNTGAMGTPDVYKKTLSVVEYGSDGVTIVDRWELSGVYPIDIDIADLDKLAEGNAVDKLKFSVDQMTFTGSGLSMNMAGNGQL
jgi:hypothetical protein